MFSDKYKQELVDEKINSMKQLDRIEFKQELSSRCSSLNFYTISKLIVNTTIYIFLFFGMFWFILYAYNYSIGVDSVSYKIGMYVSLVFSTLFCMFSILFNASYKKERKQIQEENEKFLMEHTN